MTTLMRMRRLVRTRLGVPQNDQFFADGVIDDAINLAIDVLETEQRWPWQERIVPVDVNQSDPGFATPTDWRATRSVFIEDDEMPNVSPSDLMLRSMSWQGRPEVWALVNNRVEVRPVPSGTYTLTHFYYRYATDLIDDDDVMDVPSQYAGAVVAKAAELMSVREDDRAAAAAHLTEYATWLERMRREVRRSTGPVRIRVREGSWI